MTIRHLYPAVEPSLNLDFANSKKLDSRITFTRGSTATYTDESGIIRTAAANEARFDHDSDGNSLGLLIEESRTNLVTYSEDFTNSAWKFSNEGTTTTGNQTNAPDGLLSADQIVENTATTQHRVYGWNAAWNVTNGNTYTFSIYVKANGRDEIQIYSNPGGLNRTFDLANPDSQMQELPNGWYRCWLTGTATSTSIFSVVIYMLDNGSNSYTGDGTSGVYLWGAQLEAGSFPTSYIPTTSSAVTRSADVASMTGTNFSSWYNHSAGTFYIDLPTPLTSVSNNDIIFSANNGYLDENVLLQWVTTTPYWKASNTAVATSPAKGSNAITGRYALSWDSSTIGAATDGNAAVTTNSGTVPTTATSLNIFTGGNGVRPVSGTISRLTYYPVRLSNATLQALTL